jgi:hypothetical protein
LFIVIGRLAMGLIEVTAVVGAAAAASDAFINVTKALNGARSVVIEVDNHTFGKMRRVRAHHIHGGFAVTPSSEIPPKMADIFGSQSKAFSVGTGTEGGMGYVIEGIPGELSIEWLNPFVGENRTRQAVAGGNLALFRMVNTTGAGNEHAHMRFEVFERAQAQWRGCNKCGTLFFDGSGNKGSCPQTGPHVAQSANFVLPHDVQEPGQPNWRFCKKCSAMFFDGFDDKGSCAADGRGHDGGGSFNFVLPNNRPGPGQPNWRFCKKCNVMFFDGFQDNKGKCNRDGGGHDGRGSFNFVLDHFPP